MNNIIQLIAEKVKDTIEESVILLLKNTVVVYRIIWQYIFNYKSTDLSQ